MSTMTLQIPSAQVEWFEQMVRTMGWSFTREDNVEKPQEATITPALRRRINAARKEYKQGTTVSCKTKEEMQQFFDSL